MSASARVLLLTLSERTSAKGRRYMSGWLGKVSEVAFEAEEPDRYGNAQWEVFVSSPEPRAEGKSATVVGTGRGERQKPQIVGFAASREGPAGGPRQRGDGWKGSAYRRPRAPAPAGPVEQFDDDISDIGR